MFVALFVEFHCIIILILYQTHTHTISSCTFRMFESFLIPSNGMCFGTEGRRIEAKLFYYGAIIHTYNKKEIHTEREYTYINLKREESG